MTPFERSSRLALSLMPVILATFLSGCSTLHSLFGIPRDDEMIRPDVTTCAIRNASGGLLCIQGDGWREMTIPFPEAEKYICRPSRDEEKLEDWRSRSVQ